MRKNKIRLTGFGKGYNISELEYSLFDNPQDREDYFKQKRELEQRREFAKTNENKHDKLIMQISKNPSLIGINTHRYRVNIEVDLYKGTIPAGAIDILIMTHQEDFYIEYKSSNCHYNRENAKQQLKTIEKIKGKNQGRLLFVYGNFQVEELTPSGFIPFNYTPDK